MGEVLEQSVDALVRINWLEVLKTAAAVATAVIGLLALRNWQRQDKAKREAEFLDDLIEATHAYVVEVQKPIEMLQMAKIGMASHIESWGEGTEEDKAVAGAIAYIQKRGTDDGKRLAELLNEAGPSVVKLRSLAAKGQTFRFPNYAKCQNAVAMLTWQSDRMLSFMTIIRSPTFNWEHPQVRSTLTKVMDIEPEDIWKHIGENNVALLEFAQETYRRIYGVR
jgi:hypothetical protein